jgi:hypothetical protein
MRIQTTATGMDRGSQTIGLRIACRWTPKLAELCFWGRLPFRPGRIQALLKTVRWLQDIWGVACQTNIVENCSGFLAYSNELLDLYFTFLNGFCAFVDETTFRRDMEILGPSGTSSNAYSPFLHCSILAVAAHLSNRPTHAPSPEHGPGTKGINYMQEAVRLFSKEIERPRPSTVTGLVFLWMFLADLGKTSMAWLYSGGCL